MVGDAIKGLVLDHVAIATPSLEAGSAPYVALGLGPAHEDETVESQGVRVRVFQVGETLIELLAPTRPDSPIQVFLDRRGAGLHHMAFRVPDLQQKVQEAKRARWGYEEAGASAG